MTNALSPVGWIALLAGAALIVWAFGAPASVGYSGTVNMELLVAKMLYAVAGAACAVIGAVFVAAAALVADRDVQSAPPRAGDAGDVNRAGSF